MKRKTNKTLAEKFEHCKAKLLEKRFNEASFSDIIRPSLELLDKVHTAKEAGNLNLPPVDEDNLDLAIVLGTSESDLSTMDGTVSSENLEESTKKSLQEKDRSYLQIIQDYIAEGGTGDFDQWRDWIETQPDAAKARMINRSSFKRNYENMRPSGDAANNASAAEGNVPVTNPAEPYTPSENLQSLMDLCHANEDFVETAMTTVTDKYDTIDLLLRRVVRGKSSKRYYILAGDAGIGKTYIVSKILKEEGKADDIDSITYTGSIGRSVTSIGTFLWQHRNDEILVLDDCDSFLRKGGNPDVTNILKGCMEAGTGYKVGIPASIAARITKDLKSKKESTYCNKKVSPKVAKLLEGEDEDENTFECRGCGAPISANMFELNDGYCTDCMSAADNDDESILDTDDAVPTSWTFGARMIIVSNLHESQIEEPLWSRCDHFDLHLTQEEYLIRLAMIIDDMDVGQGSNLCTPEEAKEAKALVLSVMQAVIEAGNHGVKFYGKYIQLSDHLEFRIVKDLVNMWLAMLDREVEQHPEIDRDTAKKNIMQKWVRVGVIPRMSGRKIL